MRLRKTVKQIVESGPVDFMTLMKNAVRRARLNESMEEGDDEMDSTEGLDELADDEAEGFEGDDSFDDDDLAAGDGRETVTITIPVDATLEEITTAIEAAQADGAEAEIDAEADAAADEAADDAEADAAADEAMEDFEEVEEDEEAFASTRAEAPTRKIASTTYKNQMTVDSNISPTTTMGKPATIADGSPKRRPASTSYNNSLTIKSKIQNGTRWFQ